MSRPELTKKLTSESFKRYYWLKSELICFCREMEINSSGGKIEISNRIINFLETGIVIKISRRIKAKPVSIFDWKNGKLSADNLITDNYKVSAKRTASFLRLRGV